VHQHPDIAHRAEEGTVERRIVKLGDIAAKLQECAYIACTEGYDFEKEPEKEDNFTDKNGNTYKNIAVKKPYTVTGEVYSSDKWTDANADGSPIGKLTDGSYAPTAPILW
jgi:hypothetical protein